MDLELSEEQRMLEDLVTKFVRDELMPLENTVLAREARGEGSGLTEEELEPLYARCKELGLWGLDVPESMGGACLLYTSPSPRDGLLSRMPSSA